MLIAWSGGLDSTLVLKYSLDYWYGRRIEWSWGDGDRNYEEYINWILK